MNVNQLSKRLEKVADYLPEGAYFADIGSDHAYLPCYVCLNDPTAKAVAGEVNQGPLDSAREEVASHQLQNRIDTRLGNGLAVLEKDEVNQVTVAGMGGPLIRDILEQGKDKLTSVNRIIVQPNIDARSLRRWFINNKYKLCAEEILEENGHIYEVLVAEPGNPGEPYSEGQLEKELWLGPYLLQTNSAVFQKKWREELGKKQYVLGQIMQAATPDEEKVKQIQSDIDMLKEVVQS
ncbi:tRNA (adenine-N(1))-methyltransferase [Halobacillus locisalis]|uniref:tRNA (Adenine-N(1))-methyltransferase n=1 Tax=Halobacillus locisalis TaxID=220753 RepID=A0A838CNR9_9BACI|nr:tRNA (adenine(22)-N(1))-methyltransferase TrmK [Halobacillus locisalis]MBA2173571.1 tRNA (adenine-N(1))-methyltransferase [Halobacillus locisalis]